MEIHRPVAVPTLNPGKLRLSDPLPTQSPEIVGEAARTTSPEPVPDTAVAALVRFPYMNPDNVPGAPVPPKSGLTTLPCQVPELIVPSEVMFACVALGRVDEIDGTPPELVTSTPLLPVVIEERVLAEVV